MGARALPRTQQPYVWGAIGLAKQRFVASTDRRTGAPLQALASGMPKLLSSRHVNYSERKQSRRRRWRSAASPWRGGATWPAWRSWIAKAASVPSARISSKRGGSAASGRRRTPKGGPVRPCLRAAPLPRARRRASAVLRPSAIPPASYADRPMF
jgi:hypothetical protein